MKTTIEWNAEELKRLNLSFEQFCKLCKGQYSAYYKKVSKDDLQKEYEFLTGNLIIKK